jgi:hypothetical protein
MKSGVSAVDEAGSPVRAEAGAPVQARCPHCGGRLTLRHRQRSSRPGDATYFWRHQDNASLDCPTRPSVASRIGSSGRS